MARLHRGDQRRGRILPRLRAPRVSLSSLTARKLVDVLDTGDVQPARPCFGLVLADAMRAWFVPQFSRESRTLHARTLDVCKSM